MNIHSTYFKRFFFHNLIFWLTAFIISSVVYILGSYKMSFAQFLIYLTLGTIFLVLLFLLIDLFVVYKYIKPKRLKMFEGKLFLNDKKLNIEYINSITPICYSKTNWFINVVEINYNDQYFNIIDRSQYSNNNSKSVQILLKNFPLLNSKLNANITSRKFK